jgi:arylsulfatase A-like enzyme
VSPPTDRTIDGRNLWPVLTAGAASQHEQVAWTEGPQLAIRRGEWKLVVNGITHDGTEAGSKPLEGDDAVFLSNLREDPGESRNLRRKHPEIVDDLQTRLSRWRKEVEQN